MVDMDIVKAIGKFAGDLGFDINYLADHIKLRITPYYDGYYDFDIGFDELELIISRWIRGKSTWEEVLRVSLADPTCFDKLGKTLNLRKYGPGEWHGS